MCHLFFRLKSGVASARGVLILLATLYPPVPLLAQIPRASFVAKDSIISTHQLSIPKNAEEHLARGLRKMQKRDLQGSLREIATAIELYPDYYEAYYDQGIAQGLLKRHDQALESFQKAIDLSEGRFPPAQFGYGLALCRSGRPADAEPIIRRAMETAPYLPDGYVTLGVVMLKQHRLDEAERMARESLAMSNGGDGKGYLLLSDIHGAKGEYRAEVQDLDAYLNLHPNDPDRAFLRATRDVARRIAEKMPKTSR
jgi:tetratricopeptide (TPR) repeat protein